MFGPHKVPSSKSVTEASALLNVLGGGSKETKKLLKDIGEAIENHQRAALEAKTAKKEADESIAILVADEEVNKALLESLGNQRELFRKETTEKNEALEKRGQEIKNAENVVDGKNRDFVREKTELNKAISKQRNDIDRRAVQIDSRETKVTEREMRLSKVVTELRPLSDKLTEAIKKARDI